MRLPSLSTAITLVMLKGTSPAPSSSDAVDYTLSIIEHLELRESGVFKCVFYDLSDGRLPDGPFDEILKSPRIAHVTKYVINDSFVMSYASPLPKFPSLVLINVRSANMLAYSKNLRKMAEVLNPHTRLLILFDEQHFTSLKQLAALLVYEVDFTRTVYIRTDLRALVHTGFNAAHLGLTGFVDPQELFRNLLLNMEGRRFTYSGMTGLNEADRRWMQGTARYLNATGVYMEGYCRSTKEDLRRCYMNHVRSNKVDLSLDSEVQHGLSPHEYRTLLDVIPWSNAVIVPRPRSVNVWEMFMWPFAVEAWIFLAVLLVSIEVVHLTFPGIFKNDPILLVLCGLERYNLHRAATSEKLILLAMIVYFFLMLNAYETRIISFMTGRPSIGELRNIQDLVALGIKLKISRYSHEYLIDDDRFKGIIFDDSDADRLLLDGVSAYFGAKDNMEHNMAMPFNYDFSKGRSRYYAIRESFGLRVGAYRMIKKSGLLEMFYHTERAFFEAGLLQKWAMDQFVKHFRRFTNFARKYPDKIKLLVHKNNDGDMLAMKDFLPAWIALGTGLTVSVGLFCAEIVTRIAVGKRQ